MGYRTSFDRLFARGRAAVLAGRHHRDVPPADGGRWGLSAVLRPDPAAGQPLATLTREALAVAGPGHWPTGSTATVHVTVRALETYRSAVPAGDPAAARYAAALRRAAVRSAPIRLRFDGLTLNPNGIMACAYPADGAAEAFAAQLVEALGDRGWLEAGIQRDIWYATLVHFTGPIPDPGGLVDWVAARRELDLGEVVFPEATLASWRHQGGQPALRPVAVAPLGRSG